VEAVSAAECDVDRRESQSSQPQGYSAVRVNLTRVGRIVHNSPNCRRVFVQIIDVHMPVAIV